MMGTRSGRNSFFQSMNSAGINFRAVKSPDAPKIMTVVSLVGRPDMPGTRVPGTDVELVVFDMLTPFTFSMSLFWWRSVLGEASSFTRVIQGTWMRDASTTCEAEPKPMIAEQTAE